MKHLILASLFLPGIALAQSAQPEFCISPSLAQTLAATLQQDAAMLALLNDATQEPQRLAAAVAAATAKQNVEDGRATNGGAAPNVPFSTAPVPKLASPAPTTSSTRP
jgi:hypothetical protein